MKKKIATLIALICVLLLVAWGIYALVMAPKNSVTVPTIGVTK
jgi:hypothetical protein